METLIVEQPSRSDRFDVGPDVLPKQSARGHATLESALSRLCLLVIGAGQTAEAMAARIFSAAPRRLIIANRTLSKAKLLAERYGGEAVPLESLSDGLNHADVVVSCTASEQPLLTRSAIETAVRSRYFQPLFVADIAVRGDVDAQVRGVDEVFMTTAAEVCADPTPDVQADAVMAWHQRCLLAWQQRQTSEPLRQLHQSAETARDAALQKAEKLLRSGKTPDEVLRFLANTITNKFLHPPTATLRAAALSGDKDLLRAAERLFATSEP